MIFYFSATGNSLYAAKRFSDTPVSIPQIMRGTERQFSDDAIGIACPVYAGEPPKMVKRFLRESSFQADYFYFVLTYGFDQTDARNSRPSWRQRRGSMWITSPPSRWWITICRFSTWMNRCP